MRHSPWRLSHTRTRAPSTPQDLLRAGHNVVAELEEGVLEQAAAKEKAKEKALKEKAKGRVSNLASKLGWGKKGDGGDTKGRGGGGADTTSKRSGAAGAAAADAGSSSAAAAAVAGPAAAAVLGPEIGVVEGQGVLGMLGRWAGGRGPPQRTVSMPISHTGSGLKLPAAAAATAGAAAATATGGAAGPSGHGGGAAAGGEWHVCPDTTERLDSESPVIPLLHRLQVSGCGRKAQGGGKGWVGGCLLCVAGKRAGVRGAGQSKGVARATQHWRLLTRSSLPFPSGLAALRLGPCGGGGGRRLRQWACGRGSGLAGQAATAPGVSGGCGEPCARRGGRRGGDAAHCGAL